MVQKKGLKAACLSVLALLLCIGILCIVRSRHRVETFGVLDESSLIEIPREDLPENTLYITKDRRDYRRGEMTLIIPSIQVHTLIGESTESQGLEDLPGLYEFSQMPSAGDVNVSIAGHRDIHDMVFYYLDHVRQGDYLYLLMGGQAYRYRYVETKVVAANDWSVIYPQGFSCLTLTTCDPIGTTLNRLVVTGELVDSTPYDETFHFAANESESASD